MSGRRKPNRSPAPQEPPAAEAIRRRRAGEPADRQEETAAAAPRPRRRSLEERIGYQFADPDAARQRASRTFPRSRARAIAPAAISGSNFSAITCSGLVDLRHAVSAPSRRPTRANCRAGSPISCARRPAPRSRARSISAPRIRLGASEANAGGARAAGDPRRRLRGADRRGLSRRRLSAAAALSSSGCGTSGCAATAQPLRDPKTVLQEWAQARGPADAGLSRGRAHRARTTIRSSASPCELPALAPAEGVGRSKRAAEQAAAAAMIDARRRRAGAPQWLRSGRAEPRRAAASWR